MKLKFYKYDFLGIPIDSFDVEHASDPNIESIVDETADTVFDIDSIETIDNCIERMNEINKSFTESTNTLNEYYDILFDKDTISYYTTKFNKVYYYVMTALNNKRNELLNKQKSEVKCDESKKYNKFVEEFLKENGNGKFEYADIADILDKYTKWILNL